jgi:hypothetical protein
MRSNYPWEDLYRAAIVETDDKRMPTRVHEAKSAIDSRLHDLQFDHGGTPEEREAITDALQGLNVLRQEMTSRTDKDGLA